jgi:hypothetical protein
MEYVLIWVDMGYKTGPFQGVEQRYDTHLIKVKLSLCLTEHHAMKAYCGVEL